MAEKFTKFETSIAEFQTARSDVLQRRKELEEHDAKVAEAKALLAAAEREREDKKGRLTKAVRHFKDLANKIPQLMWSDVSGVCGQDGGVSSSEVQAISAAEKLANSNTNEEAST